MFQKERLIKKYLFIFLDMINVILAFILANIIRFGKLQLFIGEDKNLYLLFAAVELFACVLCNRLFDADKNVFDRGWFKEFIVVIKTEIFVIVAGILLLFLAKESSTFPRLQMAYFMVAFFLLSYMGRQLAKKLIEINYKKAGPLNR